LKPLIGFEMTKRKANKIMKVPKDERHYHPSEYSITRHKTLENVTKAVRN